MRLTAVCQVCGVHDGVDVAERKYRRWLAGVTGLYVQEVWPRLSNQEREIIIAQRTNYYLCQKEWDEMAQQMEEEEAEEGFWDEGSPYEM